MGRFRDKLKKFAKGEVPLDNEIWGHLQFSEKISYLKGKREGLEKQRIVDLWFEDLKEDYKVKDAFDLLKKELIQEGIEPELYGVKNDAWSFNRAVNQRRTRRLQNN